MHRILVDMHRLRHNAFNGLYNYSVGLGRALISFGIVLVVVGALVSLSDKLPWLGHLPGDIHIQRGRFSFYFPLTTCVIVSIVISLVAYWFKR